MAYNPGAHLGSAERRRFIEIPKADIPSIVEEVTNPTTNEEGDTRRYAQLVYQTNPSTLELSGDVQVNTDNLETINSDGFAVLSAQNTDIQAQLNALSGVVITGFENDEHTDAFGRLRVSNPQTIFDSKQLHDKTPSFWDEALGGSGAATYVSADAMTQLSVTASSSDYAIQQTRMRFNYQPGKSQLIFLTAADLQLETGVTKRFGYFDDDGTGNNLNPNNGIFFQSDGTNISWNIAKNGAILETANQASWNADTFDGLGESGVSLDFSKTILYFIDFSWLGTGSVRVGFIVNENMHTAHIFRHSNVSDSVYMSSPNLPLRFDIQSDGSGAGAMDHICATVISEGGQDGTGVTRSASRGASVFQTQNDTDIYPLITIRLKEGQEDISVTPANISVILTSNADYRWALILNPTIAGTDAASFVPVFNSAVEYDISRDNTNKLSNGEEIATGYIDKGQKAQISSEIQDAILKLGAKIDGTRDELILAVQPVVGSNENFYGSITWREFI